MFLLVDVEEQIAEATQIHSGGKVLYQSSVRKYKSRPTEGGFCKEKRNYRTSARECRRNDVYGHINSFADNFHDCKYSKTQENVNKHKARREAGFSAMFALWNRINKCNSHRAIVAYQPHFCKLLEISILSSL